MSNHTMWMLILVVLLGCDRSSNNSPVAPVDEAVAPISSNEPTDEASTESPPEAEATPPKEEPEPTPSEEGFTLELIFIPNHRLNDAQVALVRQAAERWESVFTGGIPDFDYSSLPYDTERDFEWGTARSGRVVIDRVVDDVAVMVTTDPGITGGAWGGVNEWRAANGLPILSLGISI